ncbi:hypothetical protein NW767_012376 [Fusarium falciforme]|nr:hypothetical protein NW767_012376 [Fusarium falciforme]
MVGSKKGGSAGPAVKSGESANDAQKAKSSDPEDVQETRDFVEMLKEFEERGAKRDANEAAKRPADPTPATTPPPAKRANTNGRLQFKVSGLSGAVSNEVCKQLPDQLPEILNEAIGDGIDKQLADQLPGILTEVVRNELRNTLLGILNKRLQQFEQNLEKKLEQRFSKIKAAQNDISERQVKFENATANACLALSDRIQGKTTSKATSTAGSKGPK